MKVSSSSTASQEPQPAGFRLCNKPGYQSSRDPRLYLGTVYKAGFASGQLFPLWIRGSEFQLVSSTAQQHPGISVAAGDACPGCAAHWGCPAPWLS